MEKFSEDTNKGSVEETVIKGFEEGDIMGEQLKGFSDFGDEFIKFLSDHADDANILTKFWKLRAEFKNKYNSLLENMAVLMMESKINQEPITEGGFDVIVRSMDDLTKITNEIQTKMEEIKEEKKAA